MTHDSGSTPSRAPLSLVGGDAFAALKVVRKHSRAEGPPRAVLTVLATYADARGFSRPAVDTIARDAGVSRSTAIRALRALENELHEIRVERGTGRGHASHYWIRLDDLVERSAQAVENPVIEGLEVVGKGVTVTPFRNRKGVRVTQKGCQRDTPRTIEVPREAAGPVRGRCGQHAGVENPPPCHGCREARLAADAADEAAQVEDRRRASLERAEATKAANARAREERLARKPADPATIAAAKAAARQRPAVDDSPST